MKKLFMGLLFCGVARECLSFLDMCTLQPKQRYALLKEALSKASVQQRKAAFFPYHFFPLMMNENYRDVAGLVKKVRTLDKSTWKKCQDSRQAFNRLPLVIQKNINCLYMCRVHKRKNCTAYCRVWKFDGCEHVGQKCTCSSGVSSKSLCEEDRKRDKTQRLSLYCKC